MKKIFFIIFLICFTPSPLLAGEVDEELPMDTSARIKESAMQVISLGVENNALIKMTRSMIENHFMEQQILESYEILIKAKNEDLPEGPIMDKLYEGVSKNIQAGNIIQAMGKVRSRYETASNYAVSFLGDREQARIMTGNIAECLTAGVGTGDMDRIMEMLQQREMKRDKASELATETLKTARDMARTGVESRDIIDVMDNAFRKGYGAGEIKKLGNAFMTQARTSSSPSDLASSYSNAIKQGATADSLMKLSPGGLGGALGDLPSESPRGIGSPGGPGVPSSPGGGGMGSPR